MGAKDANTGDVGLWRPPSHLTAGSALSRRHRAGRDIVEVLIRDLRELIATVDRAGGAPQPASDAEVEGFDRFVVGLAVHLVVEDVVVGPIITRVLEREQLIEERRADIHLLGRRRAGARHLDDAGPYGNRIREVRIDLAEHAQLTEIGLLAHAYRVYEADARRALADRHPRATARMLDEVRERHGTTLSGASDLDRPFLGWLEGIARESLDIASFASTSAVKAVPPGSPRGSNSPSAARRRSSAADEPRSRHDRPGPGPDVTDPRRPLKRPEQP
jgi:hypothetical protein